jgi:uncharacterized protein (TIGR03437 family)
MIMVSLAQANFILPQETAAGTAIVEVRNGAGTVAAGSVLVQPTAPGIFSASGDGTGVAAAIAIESSKRQYPVFNCNTILQTCWAVPVAVGANRSVILALFGTGIRDGQFVAASVAGQLVPVLYAGPQGDFPGLDQINIQFQAPAFASGLLNVIVTVDGQAANGVQVLIP